jgi:hypothetical protein
MPQKGRTRIQTIAFFLAIVCPIGHNTTVPRKRSPSPDYAPERLTALYNQLQGVMPLLRDIVQPEKVEEGTALYASGPSPSADAGARYRFETKYKKGAESLIERLQAYERSIAHMAVVNATPQQAQADGRAAFPAPP